MTIRAVAFDVNGTLVDILTEDDGDAVFRAAAHTLTYAGIDVRRRELQERYRDLVAEQLRTSPETYPEFDVVAVWRSLVPQAPDQWPLFLAQLTRGVARRRLKLYPHVREVLTELRFRYPLAVVSDGQSAWARDELRHVGLLDLFDPVVISGDHGYRKPDPRLFHMVLDTLDVEPHECLFVGNDPYRDIWGAQQIGMPTVLFGEAEGAITDHRDLLKIVA